MNASHVALTRGGEGESEGHLAAPQPVREGQKGRQSHIAILGYCAVIQLISTMFLSSSDAFAFSFCK